jgi:hypothetical protein
LGIANPKDSQYFFVDWKKLGFSKGTLHYMKQNAKSDKPFTLNAHVLERVNGSSAFS